MLFQDMGVTYHFLTTTPSIEVTLGQDTSSGRDLWIDRQRRGELRLTMDRIEVHAVATPHPLLDSSGPIPVLYGANPLDDGSYHGTFQIFGSMSDTTLQKGGGAPFIGTICQATATRTLRTQHQAAT